MKTKIFLRDLVLALYNCESDEEFVELWNAIVTMRDHGFISSLQWSIFSDVCDLYFDYDHGCVLNRKFM